MHFWQDLKGFQSISSWPNRGTPASKYTSDVRGCKAWYQEVTVKSRAGTQWPQAEFLSQMCFVWHVWCKKLQIHILRPWRVTEISRFSVGLEMFVDLATPGHTFICLVSGGGCPLQMGTHSVLHHDSDPSHNARCVFPRTTPLLYVACLAPAGPWLWNLRDRLAVLLSLYSAPEKHVHPSWGPSGNSLPFRICSSCLFFPLLGRLANAYSFLSLLQWYYLHSLFLKVDYHVEDLGVSQIDSHRSSIWWGIPSTPSQCGKCHIPYRDLNQPRKIRQVISEEERLNLVMYGVD